MSLIGDFTSGLGTARQPNAYSALPTESRVRLLRFFEFPKRFGAAEKNGPGALQGSRLRSGQVEAAPDFRDSELFCGSGDRQPLRVYASTRPAPERILLPWTPGQVYSWRIIYRLASDSR